jgi:hypothetical protein
MEFNMELDEGIKYHYGSFADIHTFLDKDGNPMPLIKYVTSDETGSGSGSGSDKDSSDSSKSNKKGKSSSGGDK